MVPSGTFQSAARRAVHAAGALGILLIMIAGTWLLARDYQDTIYDAELHLDNFALVLAESTRRALPSAEPAVRAAVLGRPDERKAFAPRAELDRFFAEVYAGLDLAYEGRVFVLREGGTLLAIVPPAAAPVRDFSTHAVLTATLEGSDSGVMRARGLIDEVDRVIAYRKVRDQPLFVVISSPVSQVLAPWWRDLWIIGAGTLLLTGLFAAATLLLARQLRVSTELSQEIADSEMRLESIIASAMDAIITVDQDQNIVLFNAAAERIFRCRAADAVGTALDRFIPERFRETHRRHVARFAEAGVTARRMGAELVLSGLRTTGEEFPIDASISHSTVGGHKFFTVILRDVTERQLALERQRRAQHELEESEQRLQSIIGSAMDAIITLDEEQRVVLFNASAERIFGCPADEAIGSSIDRFIPERFRAAHCEHIRRFGEAGVTMRRMGGTIVLSGLRASGDEFPIDASISNVAVQGRRFYTVILRDISERQRAAQALARSHEQLREMYEAMHAVREAERTRIARELHDELAQWLTALKMDASWIASRLPKEHEQLVSKAERMKGVVDNTVAAMRRIAADLRPVMLDDLGLAPAIEQLLQDLAERTGVRVRYRGDGDLGIKDPLATAVYRMVQEALTNVARHAGATRVDVEVRLRSERLHVTVRDDGRGLNPDPDRKSYGVLGIRERARTLGGSARLYSPPEGGTVVEIDMPLQAHAAAGASP